MSVELFFTKPVSGAFTGAFEGQLEDRASSSVSFLGTASWAQNVESASFASTASFLLGTVESASYAVTAAHALDFDGQISASQVLPGTFQSGTYIFTGSVQITGSFDVPSITGSLLGTASWADNATSASHAINADTASLAVTASYANKARVAPMNINLNNFFGAEAKLVVPVAVTEQDSGQRTAVDLTGYTHTRLITRVTVAPSSVPGGHLFVQFATNDGGPWASLGGVPSQPSTSLDAAGTIISPWVSITGSALVDNTILRWATISGSNSGGNNRPRIASINLQLK